MRKAAWGALALVLFAVSAMRPVAAYATLHQVLGLAVLAGYILLSLDPPIDARRLRTMMFAGFACAIASIVLILSTRGLSDPNAMHAVAAIVDVLAVAVVALPLWFVNRQMQPVYAAAAALAAVGPFLGGFKAMGAADLVSIAAFTLVAGACLFTAYRLESPAVAAGKEAKKPRIVVAYDVQRLTDEEKAERLAALEKRFKAGELEEHKYWDKRQEIESR